GRRLDGGIVECQTARALWLPYVQVDEIAAATRRARRSGAAVLLEPREGPAGWRSVVATSAGGEVALWQPERRLAGVAAGDSRREALGGARPPLGRLDLAVLARRR